MNRTEDAAALKNVHVVAYLFAVTTTLFANRVLVSSGGLDLYLGTIAWAGAAMMSAAWLVVAGAHAGRSQTFPIRRLVSSSFGFVGLVLASVTVHGVHDQTVGNLFRLAFVVIGIAAAQPLVPRVLIIVRLVTILVGMKCGLVVARSLLSGSLDLATRIHLRELGGYNSMSIMLGVLIALRLSVSVLRHERIAFIEAGALSAMFVVLCLTFSRGGFIALVSGLIAIAWLSWIAPGERGLERLRARRESLRRLIPLGIAALAGAVWISRDSALSDRLLKLGGGNLSGRDRLWEAAVDQIAANPIFGIGFGKFTFTDPRLANALVEGDTTYSTHNIPLQALTDFGLVGAAIVALLVIRLVQAYWSFVIIPPIVALTAASLSGDVLAVVQVSWIVGLVLATGLWARLEPRADRSGGGLRPRRPTHALGLPRSSA